MFKINWSDDIPLVGCIAFGVIDRGTNILQIRPSSTCPLSCIFCSTDAGPKSKWRQTEYFVELDYLIHVVRELVAFKGGRHIEAHIDTVGDPTTYPHLIDLVCKLADIPGIEVISMQTHGTLLNERMIDELADAGLSRINLSIDALNEDLARKIAGADFYDINHITSIAEYISQSKIDLLIAPVWIPGINNSEIPKIVEFAKKIGAGKKWPPLGIQKYEYHKFGRKPPGVKPISWYKFYKTLRVWEKELNVKLILKPEDFNIIKLPMLPRPFKRFEKVKVTVVGPGWLKGEKIATAKGRVITLVDADDIPIGVKVYARILRTKHNIYIARVE
ncbi:MAG: radical SAM protein [archaeon GB-1867-005]|nr:radical SAM protein [Candidatus Culexmicrobium cathedralense]